MSLRTRTRPARHRAAWLLLRGLAAIGTMLPLSLLRAVGARLGRLAGVFARNDTRRVTANLRRLPGGPAPGACWADLGRRLAELLAADRALRAVDVDPDGLARLRDAIERGDGAVVATCHLGHWELMAAALARDGIDVHTLAARRGRGPLHAWLTTTRARLGVRVHHPGGGARTALRHLRGGGALAVFVDQRTGERGRPVPFLGAPAHTPATLERLQQASNAPTFLAWNARDAAGRYRVRVEPIPPTLEAVTERLEALVRAHPEQWIWLHDRWGPPPATDRSESSKERTTPICASARRLLG